MEQLTDKELKFIGFHLACRLEDYENVLKKRKAFHGAALRQFQTLEKIVYTKLIPEVWSGPKPDYWNLPDYGI